ncbi:hypothetical protein WJX81_007780 [Elliptochloris bilobata]|uniref:UBC core domain-containing protein n=1 Tax=Elliptochloris bilobata TaxID=381761 RepID=A0AAW1S3R8_9CHLO
MTAHTRLAKEIKEYSRLGAASDVLLQVDESNILLWRAFVKGPADTPFEGGTFELALNVPEHYPLQPPSVRFRTKVFHPNFHFKTGEICLDILKHAWSPAWTLQAVCQAIVTLMGDAAPDSPLNCDAGNLLRANDWRGYNSLARMYTLELAMARK